MNIIYIITILAIYILFILKHKTEKKQNILAWIPISIIFILCYNILICLILTFIGIKCTLINLNICNIVIMGCFSVILLKDKKTQKYYFKISDLAYYILLLFLVVFIGYKQYENPFNIKYEITDGSTHYHFAQQFSENQTLLYNGATDDVLMIYNSGFRLPGAYVNEGILFRVFDKILHPVDIFIIFDLFILYMSGILFYYLLKTYAKENKKMQCLAVIFSIMYMLGYQLNSMLMGYVYLSLALDIIICFMLLMANYKKQEINLKIALPILSLVSFGIFFSYAYFVPIIYISVIINIIVRAKSKKQKIFETQNIIELIYVIVIPLILGIFYFIVFPIINGGKTEISTIGVDGAIYENFITNYIGIIPILIVGIIIGRKNKEANEKNYFQTILFIAAILFSIILFIGYKLEIVSKYYFFKSYYITWILAIYNTYIVLSNILTGKNNKLKIISYIYVSFVLILIILSTLILRKNIGINDIFYKNLELIQDEKVILKGGELDILEKVEKTIEYNNIYILHPSMYGKAHWMSVLYHNQLIYIDCITGYNVTIEKWLTEKEQKYYLAYYDDYNLLTEEEKSLNRNSSEYKIIHNDEYGFILERTET